MELMNNWRKRMSERRVIRRLVALLAVGGVSMTMMGEALAAEPEAAKPAETAETPKYMLEDVVVTAERIPTKRMDTPVNVSVITAEEIEDNHYRDVAEALMHLNGVIISNGASGNNQVVRINGDERVVIMIDGRRLNNDQGSMTRASANLEMIASMKNIERIEVIKGAGSALYGSDAIGGVINIITKKGKELKTTLDVNFGSWSTQNYEVAHQGSEKNLSWFITGGFSRRNHFDYKYEGSNNSMPNSDRKSNSLTVRIDGTIDDCSSVRLDFEHRAIYGGAYTGIYTNINANGKQDELFNNVALTYNFKEDTDTPGFLRVYNNYKWASFGLDDTGMQNAPFDTKTFGVDYQNGWEFGKTNKLIAGAEWRESKSENLGEHAGNYKDATIINKALYVQDTWNFASKWSLVPGVRVDHHSMFGTHWSPKVALNYNANDKTQVYASWGRVYKAPTADDLYYTDPVYFMFGNPNLRPETGHTETIGINHQIDKNTSVGASMFWSKIHDAIYWDFDPMAGVMCPSNIALEQKRGFEISVQKKFNDNWSADLAYSYIRTEARGSATSSDVTEKNQQPNGYRAGVHFHKGPWKANLLGTFGSGLDCRFFSVSSYAVIDFNSSYDVTNDITLYFKVNNLTNQEYQLSPLPAWGPIQPAQGRFFQCGVTYSF